jgi:3-phosphoshikimate 1-carboxyvinyltransferase
MPKHIIIKKKINSFNKKIRVPGDKSLSIRWALLASQALGKSKAYNLLKSEDVLSALKGLKKLGVKIKLNKKFCEIDGVGINGFRYKKNLTIDAGNSGTFGRLILALLIRSPYKIKLIGDKSLSRRDFSRVINPLKEFGASFYPADKFTLPIYIQGTNFVRPIKYFEKKGSAQIKSCVMLAALNAPGTTKIKALKSRNHTEILYKFLKIPFLVSSKKKIDLIEIGGEKKINPFNYNIPSDISSSAFFIVLTLLSDKSFLIIKNVNVNPSRTGCINILNKMGANIVLKNKKKYKGEKIADIHVRSKKYFKSINCPKKYNTSAIDEFLILFLVAAKAKGISYFKDLSELNQKESPRLKLGSKILNMIGIKTKLTHNSIKIYGNPNLKLKKTFEIKNYFKDHRIMALSTIAALTLGGKWKIYDPDSIKTSFPSFFNILKENLGAKIN